MIEVPLELVDLLVRLTQDSYLRSSNKLSSNVTRQLRFLANNCGEVAKLIIKSRGRSPVASSNFLATISADVLTRESKRFASLAQILIDREVSANLKLSTSIESDRTHRSPINRRVRENQ